MTEVEFLKRELDRQLKAVDDLNKMIKDLSQITFESKMDKWLKASKAKEWVSLTEEDLKPICDEWRIIYGAWTHDFAKEIEAKLKDKNT